MIIGIVAVDRQGAIGKGGKLPWHYSADMKFFRKTTIGNACVMGSRTWKSLDQPLKKRLNIVLSRGGDIGRADMSIVLRGVDSVLSLNSYLNCDLFVIGGEKVYKSFLPHIERWIVTEVPLTVEDADTFVPEDYTEGFAKVRSLELEKDLVVSIYDRVDWTNYGTL